MEASQDYPATKRDHLVSVDVSDLKPREVLPSGRDTSGSSFGPTHSVSGGRRLEFDANNYGEGVVRPEPGTCL